MAVAVAVEEEAATEMPGARGGIRKQSEEVLWWWEFWLFGGEAPIYLDFGSFLCCCAGPPVRFE
jgi:hypothetical protein